MQDASRNCGQTLPYLNWLFKTKLAVALDESAGGVGSRLPVLTEFKHSPVASECQDVVLSAIGELEELGKHGRRRSHSSEAAAFELPP
jgi:hypothetical protein